VIDSMPRIPRPQETIIKAVNLVWELKHWALRHVGRSVLIVFGHEGTFLASLAAHLGAWTRVVTIYNGDSKIMLDNVAHLSHYRSFDAFLQDWAPYLNEYHRQVVYTDAFHIAPNISGVLKMHQCALCYRSRELARHNLDYSALPLYISEHMPLDRVRFFRRFEWPGNPSIIISEVTR